MHLPRITRQTVLVLAALLADPFGEHYGRGLADATGLSPATVHLILVRFQAAGVLTAWWEDGDVAARHRRPRRRYYRMTPDGAAACREALASPSPPCRCPNCRRTA